MEEIEDKTINEDYSYSSHKLFKYSSNLTDEDKTFILFRFRLLKSILLFDSIFSKGNISMTNTDKRVFNFDLKNYFRKYKSIIICIIGKDLMSLNSSYSKKLISYLDNKLPNNFYSINRKLRDHIHYVEKIIPLSKSEEKMLDKLQNIYINFLYDNIIKNLNIDIDNECLAMTKAVKECQDKNMSVDEIKQNYIPYYLKHYYELIKDDLSS